MKKKVCIIHKVKTLDPRSFYKQGLTLSNSGYDVSFIGLFEKCGTFLGIKLIGIKEPRNRISRFIFTNYKIICTAIKCKANIYHFHDLDFLIWAIILKIYTKSIVIYDVHEAHPEYMLLKSYIPIYLRKIFFCIIFILERFSIKFFDAIIPNDNFILKNCRHKNKITIYNFPLLDFFTVKNEYLCFEKEYDLFYHGSLPKYHFETMMNISERLNLKGIKNIWGIIMHPTSPRSWIKSQVKKKNLESNFDFIPYVNYLDVAKFIYKAKIGIIPLPPFEKFKKNIPLKMFEFMGCGLPVILSDLPPSRQFIYDKNCAILVEPDNIQEYVDAIEYLLKNPDLCNKMGECGRQLVLNRLNWNREAEKLLALYKKME